MKFVFIRQLQSRLALHLVTKALFKSAAEMKKVGSDLCCIRGNT